MRNPIVNLNSPLRGLLMLCMVVMAGCGSCQGSTPSCDPSQAGTEGCACRTDSASCNAGLVCNSGACVPCGAEGQECCVSGASGVCGGSLMCVMESAGEVCRNCGDLGEACCNSSGAQVCNAGGNCVGGACQSVTGGACDPGGSIFTVGIQDMNLCAVRVVEVRATTAANAMTCATTSGMLNSGEAFFEVPNTPIADFDMCVETESDGRRSTSVRAFGDFEARRCTLFTRCGAAGCVSVRPGICT
ncbi:hypothetical protein HUA78_01520 [Myxococcus sp. CA033]|nr:hypothetical protein [Myxococcus sp. CA033]NTX33108.1 hypothetical protein [Myxococcus sp. CA033]